jgi:hypothetical protein
MMELEQRLDGAYVRRHLATLAAKGEIPCAKRTPSGKHWMFRDTPRLAGWIRETIKTRSVQVKRAAAKRAADLADLSFTYDPEQSGQPWQRYNRR